MKVLLSVAVLLLGALVYGYAKGEAKALGLYMFACGLLAALLYYNGHTMTLP